MPEENPAPQNPNVTVTQKVGEVEVTVEVGQGGEVAAAPQAQYGRRAGDKPAPAPPTQAAEQPAQPDAAQPPEQQPNSSASGQAVKSQPKKIVEKLVRGDKNTWVALAAGFVIVAVLAIIIIVIVIALRPHSDTTSALPAAAVTSGPVPRLGLPAANPSVSVVPGSAVFTE